MQLKKQLALPIWTLRHVPDSAVLETMAKDDGQLKSPAGFEETAPVTGMILRPLAREPGTTYVKGTPSVVGDRPEGNPLGVAAMIVGLCGIALYWLPWVNLICPAGSIIIGSLSLHKASKGSTTSSLPAVAGLLLGCLLFLIGLFVIEIALSLAAVPGQPGEASL